MTTNKNITIKDAFNDELLKMEYMDISGCTDENESVQRNRKRKFLEIYVKKDTLDLKGIDYLLKKKGDLVIFVKSDINEIEISNLELIKDCRSLQIYNELGYPVIVNSPDINSIHFNNIEVLDMIPTFKVYVDKINNLCTAPEGLSNINIKEINNINIYLTKEKLQNEVNLNFENIEIVSNLYLRLPDNSNIEYNPFIRLHGISELIIMEINLCFYVQDAFYLVADDVVDIESKEFVYYNDNLPSIYFINVKVTDNLIKNLNQLGHEVFII